MARRRHVSKRPLEQQYYVQRISRLGYEPTAEEEFEVPESADSDQLEESTAIRTSGATRSRSTGGGIIDHFKRNGVIWIIAILTLLLVIGIPFMIDFNGSIERIEATIDGIKENLNRQETELQDIEEKVHDQELKLQEQGIKLEYLEEDLKEKSPSPP